jgi:hypothetical protein
MLRLIMITPGSDTWRTGVSRSETSACLWAAARVSLAELDCGWVVCPLLLLPV